MMRNGVSHLEHEDSNEDTEALDSFPSMPLPTSLARAATQLPIPPRMVSKSLLSRATSDSLIGVAPLPLTRSSSNSDTRRLRMALTRARSKREFVMRSTTRGSNLWEDMMRPFVSNLAFRCLTRRRTESDVSFRPYSCHAAVLFVDISGYSTVAAAISHRGAYVLSSIVNAYLDRLLRVAQLYGGDVVKFAGDAVLILWEGEEKDLGINVHCAAQCAMDMQAKADSHPVDGTDLFFRIHCGISCGAVDSEIFVAPTHVNMQRLYHAVGGEPLIEISELVNLAAAGEVAVSGDCIEYLGDRGGYDALSGSSDAMLLKELYIEPTLRECMESHIERAAQDHLLRRDMEVEEDFVHPSVLTQLLHGGLTPTQICQMRNLCVLFIGMTSQGNAVNWLMEVQGVLDTYRCPIVQIIDDDKGVHVVAAVNLHESVPETSILALDACRELVKKQVGCAVGLAMGTTWCGIIGSYSVGCRWDIVGPPAVRAARLMQYALMHDVEVVIDVSVYQNSLVSPRMKLLHPGIRVKGSPELVPVFTLSDSTNFSAFMVLETFQFASVHDDVVRKIEAHILSTKNRGGVIVTGPPLSGKKVVCQRAAGRASMCPVLHVCDETAGLLQLARTIATWFKHFQSEDVQCLADSTLFHLEHKRWCRAHDECVRLVKTVVAEGLNGCFVVDRIQVLDDFSISLVRECLRGKPSSRRLFRRNSAASSSDHEQDHAPGKIFFLFVHVPLYHWRTAQCIVEDISRSRKIHIPVFEVAQVSVDEIRAVPTEVLDMNVDNRWANLFAETSGRCIGYLFARVHAVRSLSGVLWRQGRPGLIDVTECYSLHVPRRAGRKIKNINVMQVDAEVAMRFSQVFDELPPRFQSLIKVLNLATRRCSYKVPRRIVWEVLNDLIEEGVELSCYLDMLTEMQAMYLIKTEGSDDNTRLSLLCPALGDVVMELCTPFQIKSICTALVERMEPLLFTRDFKLPLVLASLHGRLETNQELQKELWRQSYQFLLQNSRQSFLGEDFISSQKELIEEEIEEEGFDAHDVLGDAFTISMCKIPTVHHKFSLLTTYAAPIAFGQMGHSLNVITRNVCIQMREFHGRPADVIQKLRHDTASALCRYTQELYKLEQYMTEYACGVPSDDLGDEMSLLDSIVEPGANKDDVAIKIEAMLDIYIPCYVDPRRERLHQLIKTLRIGGIPDIVKNAPEAIRLAYLALQTPRDRNDAAQDALVVLATLTFKPKILEEYLPIMFYQTVARIRDLVLRRLSAEDLAIHRHQHSVDDLEAFLVVTALFLSKQRMS